MEKVYAEAKALRALNGNSIYIKSVYFPYYTGYVEAEKRFHTFIRFPIIADDIIMQGDERSKPKTPGEKMEFREKIWVDGKVAFQKFKGKVNGDFFKMFKKTFDVALETSVPVTVKVWDKLEKANVDVTSNNFVIPFGASKIKKALQDMKLDRDVEKVEGTDKLGKPAKVMPFDYEDGIRGDLVGKFMAVEVLGEGMDTRYIFEKTEPFAISEDAAMQATKGAIAANGNGNSFAKSNAEIEFADIPF